jgi:DNA-binding CsgD family transcriptional regulator
MKQMAVGRVVARSNVLIVNERIVSFMLQQSSAEPVLTRAEKRVLSLVSQSKTNREIAASLRISPATVKRHLENILRKLGVRNRLEAAIYHLSMVGSCAPSKSDCPLVEWRKWHDNERNGPIGR